MARAKYLHVITDPTKTGFDSIVGIFTVKHQMNTAITRHGWDMTKLKYDRAVDGYYMQVQKTPTSRCQDCGCDVINGQNGSIMQFSYGTEIICWECDDKRGVDTAC